MLRNNSNQFDPKPVTTGDEEMRNISPATIRANLRQCWQDLEYQLSFSFDRRLEEASWYLDKAVKELEGWAEPDQNVEDETV
jgi:hypothetical protein